MSTAAIGPSSVAPLNQNVPASLTGQDKKVTLTALDILKAKAEAGDARAQNDLGVELIYTRDTIGHNDPEAFKWIQKAALQGLAAAQYNAGVMLATGRGIPINKSEAVKWYRKAAEQGDDLAQHNLAWMLENGDGVAKDEKEAVLWYQKAIAQSNRVGSHYNLNQLLAKMGK